MVALALGLERFIVNTSVPSAIGVVDQLHGHGLDRLAGGEGQRARASNVVVAAAAVLLAVL